MFSFVN